MEGFIPTRVSKVKRQAVHEFRSITYENRKKKEKVKVAEDQEENGMLRFKCNKGSNRRIEDDDPTKKQEREMKRIRYEVIKFGMSGFGKVKAEEAKVALAVSLGAKPPKKPNINYKVLKEQKKCGTGKRITLASGLENSLTKYKNAKKIRRKDSNDILGIYGKVEKKMVKRKK